MGFIINHNPKPERLGSLKKASCYTPVILDFMDDATLIKAIAQIII